MRVLLRNGVIYANGPQPLTAMLLADDRIVWIGTDHAAHEADRIVALVNRMEVFSDRRPIERHAVNIHDVLDQRPVDHRQHLLGHGLGGGQEAGAEARDREYGRANRFHGWILSELRGRLRLSRRERQEGSTPKMDGSFGRIVML